MRTSRDAAVMAINSSTRLKPFFIPPSRGRYGFLPYSHVLKKEGILK
jgi:hypothetical protein